jgi:hypothetical protein
VATGDGITVVDASDPFNLSIAGSIEAGEVTSVSVKNGLLAAALPGATVTDNGQVLFYDSSQPGLPGVGGGGRPAGHAHLRFQRRVSAGGQ